MFVGWPDRWIDGWGQTAGPECVSMEEFENKLIALEQ